MSAPATSINSHVQNGETNMELFKNGRWLDSTPKQVATAVAVVSTPASGLYIQLNLFHCEFQEPLTSFIRVP